MTTDQDQQEAQALAALFAQGTRHHAAGRLAEAEAVYRQVLAAQPRHADSLHLLGVIAYQTGHLGPAADLIRQAIAVRGDVAFFYTNLGKVLDDQGQPDAAAACFQRALSLDAGSVAAHVGLGDIRQGQGRLEDAVAAYTHALGLNPTDANAHNNLGGALMALGRPAEALVSFERAAELTPGRADVHYNRANALRDLGRAEAAPAYRQALALDPNHRGALYNLANLLLADRRPAEAEPLYRALLAAVPDHVDALMNLGVALHGLNRPDEAEARLARARALTPTRADVLNNLGSVLMRDKTRREEASDLLRRALDIQPDLADAHANLAYVLVAQGRWDAARPHAERAVQLRPGNAEGHMALGAVLMAAGDLTAALDRALEAARLAPDNATAHGNVAMLLSGQGRPAEALDYFERALALPGASADIIWARSLTRLLLGDFALGWRDYEARWQTGQMAPAKRNFPQPQWRGEPAAGRTLLLHSEQGFGDSLQFCRYAPLAAALGFRVVLEVRPPLVRLMRSLAGAAQVVAEGDPLPPFDTHSPLMSLPLAFGTRPDTIPAPPAYLAADPADAIAWRDRVAVSCPAGTRLRVGLVWVGNSRMDLPEMVAVNSRRSLDARLLAPLMDVPGVAFFSLQKDAAVPDGLPIIDLMAGVRDFADTAALVANLDLVISVDTAVAHLAGALGRPVWLMNRFDSCWRWFLERTDTPWYPTMRLFRQAAPGDWRTPLRQVRTALEEAVLAAG
ncbi:tetratricopeptide repeat protein [Azospirillum sp. B4]|uniref:tetratricopeptide repeat protein n=1 Tax=Azospirillum sp. B4 TaxID=95605 RepID=UPI000345CFFF|nr:tetratricopeptide repeat protein [Azospirillum sp. B4]